MRTIASLDDPLIYVFDVQVLTAKKVFFCEEPSLAQILEGDAQAGTKAVPSIPLC